MSSELKYMGIVTDKFNNLTVKEKKALEDSAENFRKTNSFKVYGNDTTDSLNKRFNLNLSTEMLNIVSVNSKEPYDMFLILFIVKRIQASNRPPIKIEKLSLQDYETFKTYLESLH